MYVGTWVNPDYNGDMWNQTGIGAPAKQVIKEDGTGDLYDKVTDTVPIGSTTYTITDQNGDIYRVISVVPSGTYYCTARITSTTMEGKWSDAGYPPSPDPPDFTYTRQ